MINIWKHSMNCSRPKVLIIDDEKMILEMLSQRLRRSGFFVDVAENAEDGISKIITNSYDLVITDIRMPGMSGDNVLKYVKNHAERPIPIIAMSGTPWLFENSSFDAVIVKPFSKEELLKVMSQFVRIPQP